VITQTLYSRLVPWALVSHVDKKACPPCNDNYLFFTILRFKILVDNLAVELSLVCKFTHVQIKYCEHVTPSLNVILRRVVSHRKKDKDVWLYCDIAISFTWMHKIPSFACSGIVYIHTYIQTAQVKSSVLFSYLCTTWCSVSEDFSDHEVEYWAALAASLRALRRAFRSSMIRL